MAEIVPFAGLRYDLARVDDAARVLAPPYDVIGEAERAELEARHPHNVVRLELPRGEGDARYGAAANLLAAWRAEGVLRREATPSMYLYEQEFSWAGKRYARQGFIAGVRLEPFDKRVVLPHEHTLTGPKEDRRKLLVATRTQISQVFGLYRDADGAALGELAAVAAGEPALDGTTSDGTRHRLWVISEAARLNRLAGVLRDKQLLIADGHHRYETMLALRGELRGAGGAGAREPADYGAMYLARAEDPGLLVLPTHRLVKGLEDFSLPRFLSGAGAAFEVIPGEETTAQAVEARLAQLAVGEDGQRRVAFGVRAAGMHGPTWLVLKSIVDLSALGPPALRSLDVTVLHGVLLGPLLGIDAAAMAKQTNLAYTHDTSEALARVDAGEVQAAFLMSATSVSQVLEACEQGHVLPQKSTYFQPKLATGLVMYAVERGTLSPQR
ncbi:MAG TPA: DUF1015 domain-containing protein [Polyangia bacterium]|jgi:uncharacterized protein (DUF1015 family)|nr:DUF1015 domain-containing protein [Polyangia bacterium]